MATHATSEMSRRAQLWEDIYSSAVFSGIVGDANHGSGYHISIEDNPAGNYSIILPDDAAPPGNWPRNQASGTDMSMSTADMKTDYARMLRLFNDKSDPRRKYIRGYNGWDGVGSAKRLDFAKNTIGTSSSDHKWHGHREDYRRYVNDPEATRAIISAHKGETKEQYLGRSVMSLYCQRGDGIDNKDPDRINNVWYAQLRLQELGWLRSAREPHEPVPADGAYGPDTAFSIAEAPTPDGRPLTGGDPSGNTMGPWEIFRLDYCYQAMLFDRWATELPGDGGTGAGPHKHDTPGLEFGVTIPSQQITLTIPGITATGTTGTGETGPAEPL